MTRSSRAAPLAAVLTLALGLAVAPTAAADSNRGPARGRLAVPAVYLGGPIEASPQVVHHRRHRGHRWRGGRSYGHRRYRHGYDYGYRWRKGYGQGWHRSDRHPHGHRRQRRH